MTNDFKWRCQGCGHLLGIADGDRLHIRFARGHQYWAALPVTCVCKNPSCKTLNELRRIPCGIPSGSVSPRPR